VGATRKDAAVAETVMARGTPMTVLASPEARAALGERGGDLYLWTSAHGCCTGGITLLEADTTPPPAGDHQFERVAGRSFDLFIDLGARRPPEELVLELRGRRKRITAFWNGQAWVG
jgi:hypothetical protein